jgi:hypothetical protein
MLDIEDFRFVPQELRGEAFGGDTEDTPFEALIANLL